MSINISAMLQNIESNENILTSIVDSFESITGKKFYYDYNYRSGKLMGILRYISQNATHEDELLNASHLTKGHIQLYIQYAGNLPYIDKRSGKMIPARPQNQEVLIELLKHTASTLGLSEPDTSDITSEQWDRLVSQAYERCQDNLPSSEGNVTYVE